MGKTRDIGRYGFVLLVSICALLAAVAAVSRADASSHHYSNHHASHHQPKHHRNACREWGKVQPQHLKAPQARKSVACLLNKKRAQHGLHKLKLLKRLNHAAQDHSRYMLRRHCFDHACPGERSLDSRLQRVRYLGGRLRSWTYGENIAWGQRQLGTPKQMVKAWMHSPGHRANILNGDFRDLGIGFETGSPSKRSDKAGIFTTDFGHRVRG